MEANEYRLAKRCERHFPNNNESKPVAVIGGTLYQNLGTYWFRLWRLLYYGFVKYVTI